MQQLEFINLMIGKPWVNRADTVDEVDCYGLVKLYKSMVDGIKLPQATGYKEGFAFTSIWRRETKRVWWQVGKWTDGAMVTFYDNSMQAVHIGICVGNQQVLHARGNATDGGKVEIHSIIVLSKAYKAVSFHEVING